jgi:hypothetical protein
LVLGNLGNNTAWKASEKEPVTITYGDLYGNGVNEPILCYYNNGKSYPYFSRDELVSQIPSLQKKILHYADYADAQLTDLFSDAQLAASKTAAINNTASIYLQNDKGKGFTVKTLPPYAQLSVLNGLVGTDINNDGFEDIIGAGNFYPFRAQMGPQDAGMGIVLKGDGKGGFAPLLYDETRFAMQGDVRNIIKVASNQKGAFFIIAAKNNGQVQVVKVTGSH